MQCTPVQNVLTTSERPAQQRTVARETRLTVCTEYASGRPALDCNCAIEARLRTAADYDVWSWSKSYEHGWLDLAALQTYPTTCSLC